MLTNYERVMKKFIPAFRLKAAQMMVNKYGINQSRAAAILGTTQAAVSKYLKANSEKYKNVEIDGKSVAIFIENMNQNKAKAGQKIVCRMCQNNKKFDCTFIVK